MLFSMRAVAETLVWSLIVVEGEVGAQASLQVVSCVILLKTDFLVFGATPLAFAEDVFEGAAVHADL